MSAAAENGDVRFGLVVPHMAVPDVVRAAEYYRDVLGFDVAGYWDGDEQHSDPSRPALFGIVGRGNARIHFNRGAHDRLPSRAADGAYDLYFHITNVDAFADVVCRRGADILEGPEDRVYGQRELVIRDCNGFILAFGEQLTA